MSNQAMDQFEGLTLKVIGQIVEVNYHGVEIQTENGNGILGKMINPIIGMQSTNQTSQLVTTCAKEIDRIPTKELSKEKLSYIQKVRASLIAENADVNVKVSNFHEKLNSLKKGLLKGRTSNFVDMTELNEVREAMIDFNVGKVLKIKIQARMFSKEIIPGYNKVKTGGSSQVNVIYTFYVPYVEGEDLQVIVDNIAKRFADGKNQSIHNVNTQAYKAKVELDSNDRITIIPQRPVTTVQLPDSSGGTESVPIEEIRKSKGFTTRAMDAFSDTKADVFK